MAVPTLRSDLSTTAASNSPAGSESTGAAGASNIDNYFRAHASFIAANYADIVAAQADIDALQAPALALVNLNGSNQTITAASQTTLQFVDTAGIDTDSYWNNTTFRFVPTVAGYFAVDLHLIVYDTALESCGDIVGRIRKNGSAVSQTFWNDAPTTDNMPLSTMALIQCNGSTDYIDFSIEYASGTLLVDGNAARSFGIIRRVR